MKCLKPKEIAAYFQIGMPLERPIYVTQPFGVNFVDFYTKLGLKGHNGIDYRADRGTDILASFSGIITDAGENSGWGIYVKQESEDIKIDGQIIKVEAIYAHLDRLKCKKGERVSVAQVIGTTDNTGTFTTGDHLHFGIRIWYITGGVIKYEDNGYGGWIDPDELFWDRGWNLLPVQRRYNRTDCWNLERPKWRPWHAYLNEIRIARALRKYLGVNPSNEQISACVYGGWDRDNVGNPAMFPIWAELKKDEFLAGKKPKLRLGLNSLIFK